MSFTNYGFDSLGHFGLLEKIITIINSKFNENKINNDLKNILLLKFSNFGSFLSIMISFNNTSPISNDELATFGAAIEKSLILRIIYFFVGKNVEFKKFRNLSKLFEF